MASPGLEKTSEEQAQRVVTGRTDRNDVDSPAYECVSYAAQIDDVRMMGDVHGGTKSMRKKGEKYLPKAPFETEKKYKVRLNAAVAFNALKRTVMGLTGMIFRRDPVLSDDMDTGIAEATDDIDRRGHKLPVFMHRIAKHALRDGHVWIHVEAPRAGAAADRAQERAKGLRPYWIPVKKAEAINWRSEIRDGEPVLTLFVYRTGGIEPDGLFGEREVDQIRVLRETVMGVRGELWEFREKTKDTPAHWLQVDEYPIANERVPVVFLPSNESGAAFESEPPLIDLAYEQIEHYRVRSERQKSLSFTAVSVPYVFGKDVVDDDGNSKVKWSADSVMLLNDPDATAGMIESAGNGLAAQKDELSDIEARMASLGMQMLVRPSGPQPGSGDVTATSDLLRRTETEAPLVLFADAIETAANEGLKLHAGYGVKKPDPGTITINRDFHDKLLDPQTAKVLHEMVASGDLSRETFWGRLVEGELLDESFDAKEERARIANESADRLTDIERAMAAAEASAQDGAD